MKVHALQAKVHIGVFLHPPVTAIQVIGDYLIVLDELQAIPYSLVLFTVKDISFSGLVMVIANQYLFYQVLNILYGGISYLSIKE
jgi:hypothetical protein